MTVLDAVDDLDDGDEDEALPWWSLSSLTDLRGLAVAALVLAAISLIGVGAGHEIAEGLEFSGRSAFHSLSAIDGIQAGVAFVAVGLGLYVVREEWIAEEVSWAGWLARAAIVVGTLAFVIDLVGVIIVLSLHAHVPTPEGSAVLVYHLQS